jgi:glucosamine--fructose-6-phosphate aminotransferase (isomerizing)
MCGIVGGVSKRNVLPILVEGLKRLEYRGYDSAGVAYRQGSKVNQVKTIGRVAELEKSIVNEHEPNIGIAHTRWATHGVPSVKNAHPQSSSNEIYIVHNGIIENHDKLREKLKAEGFKFKSDTDTEVIAHLIYLYREQGHDFDSAVLRATKDLKGAFALGVLDKNEPEQIIGAREHSPLVVGEGVDENFIASDIMALSQVTNRFKFLNDGQIAIIGQNKIEIIGKNGTSKNIKTQEVDSTAYTNDLGGYNHFMEKEIFEQPQAILNSIAGRVSKNGAQEGVFGAGFEQAVADIFKYSSYSVWHQLPCRENF